MADHYDLLETRAPEARERDLLARLPALVAGAMKAPAWAAHLAGVEAKAVTSRVALAKLPVLRKSELPGMQKNNPPFAGFLSHPIADFGRLFTSPGPIYELEAAVADPWRSARSLFAAGFRAG